jgi:rhodanese-related sulfurtransferase
MKLIKEILIIIVVSSALGLIYNFQQEKPLPMIYEPKTFDQVSDDELFGSVNEFESDLEENVQKPNENKENSQESIKINIEEDKIGDAEKEDTSQQKVEENKDIAEKSIKQEKKENPTLDLSSKSDDIHERTITYEQMLKILKMEEKFVIIDARNHEQFQEDKIGNAINIFPYNPDMDEIANKIMSLPFDKTLIIYCDGGECDSSHKLADLMMDFGYSDLYIFTGGWEEWVKKRGL